MDIKKTEGLFSPSVIILLREVSIFRILSFTKESYGTSLSNIITKERKIVKMAKKDLIVCAGEGQSLLKCTGGKLEADFYPSFNMWGNGHTKYCKKCLDKIYDYYYKNSGENDKVALYHTLVQENIPFITEIYDKLSVNMPKVTINKYCTELAKRTQKETMWNDFSASDFKLVDNGSFKDQEELKELIKKWGDGSKADYEFLEETYDRYTEDLDELSVAQQDLFRDLCRDRLLLRKINDGVYIGDETLDKVQSRISKTMSKLKIDNFAEKKEYTISEQLMFNKIAQIELTKPADLYKEPKKYKDFNKVRKYYQDICLRALKNCLIGTKEFNVNMDDLSEYKLEEDNG